MLITNNHSLIIQIIAGYQHLVLLHFELLFTFKNVLLQEASKTIA